MVQERTLADLPSEVEVPPCNLALILLLSSQDRNNGPQIYEQHLQSIQSLCGHGQDVSIVVHLFDPAGNELLFSLPRNKKWQDVETEREPLGVSFTHDVDGIVDLVEYVRERTNCQKLGIVIAGHGNPPDKIQFWPPTAPTEFLSVTKLAQTFEDRDIQPLSFLILNCCYMATLEVAYSLQHTTRFLIANSLDITAPHPTSFLRWIEWIACHGDWTEDDDLSLLSMACMWPRPQGHSVSVCIDSSRVKHLCEALDEWVKCLVQWQKSDARSFHEAASTLITQLRCTPKDTFEIGDCVDTLIEQNGTSLDPLLLIQGIRLKEKLAQCVIGNMATCQARKNFGCGGLKVGFSRDWIRRSKRDFPTTGFYHDHFWARFVDLFTLNGDSRA